MLEVISFKFKGSRTYIQGTSLFNALASTAERREMGSGRINVLFRKIINTPECILEERPGTAEDAVVAKIVSRSGESRSLCINPGSEKATAVREDYDESEVCRGSIIGDKSIFQSQPHHIDRIELLVSLCKKMHIECVDREKKWVFSRYDGVFPIPEISQVEIRLMKQVGTRLTCSDVLVNGEKVADMYFS